MHEQGSNIKFTGYHWPLKAFIVLYTDFESILKNLEKLIGIILMNLTLKKQENTARSYWNKVVFIDESMNKNIGVKM